MDMDVDLELEMKISRIWGRKFHRFINEQKADTLIEALCQCLVSVSVAVDTDYAGEAIVSVESVSVS
jgi:hypothetical protein